MNNMNVTLGQYVKGNSFLHKLDPRIKILATIVLLVAVFLLPINSIINLYILLGFLCLLAIILVFARISLISVIKGIEPVLLIGAFTFILQIVYPGENPGYEMISPITFNFSWITILLCVAILALVLFSLKCVKLKMVYVILGIVVAVLPSIFISNFAFYSYSLKIMSNGVLRGSFFFVRLVLVILITTMLTSTTPTTDINLGIEKLLYPLALIKVPVSEFAMMLSLTLRFIPTLMIEADKIMKAQASRGIDFNEGNILEKIKQIVTLLIPMFVVSISKAEDLANAMEARGYIIGAKRTSVSELKLRFADLVAFVFVALMLSGSIVVRVIL